MKGIVLYDGLLKVFFEGGLRAVYGSQQGCSGKDAKNHFFLKKPNDSRQNTQIYERAVGT